MTERPTWRPSDTPRSVKRGITFVYKPFGQFPLTHTSWRVPTSVIVPWVRSTQTAVRVPVMTQIRDADNDLYIALRY